MRCLVGPGVVGLGQAVWVVVRGPIVGLALHPIVVLHPAVVLHPVVVLHLVVVLHPVMVWYDIVVLKGEGWWRGSGRVVVVVVYRDVN